MDNYNKGITLIALIIVIIIMLILVGVTVNVALNGELFIKTKQASNRTNDEVLRERIISYVIGAISEDGMFEFEKFRNNICKLDGEKEYFGDNTVIRKKYFRLRDGRAGYREACIGDHRPDTASGKD